MRFLETKIPPPLAAVLFGLLIWFIARNTAPVQISVGISYVLTSLFLITGFCFSIAGVAAFSRANTTVNPLQPDEATVLVQTGVFRISRNPMYVGVTLMLMGWCVYLATLIGLLGVAGFVLYIDRFQIRPEEEALTKLFGDEFLAYKEKVRRWV